VQSFITGNSTVFLFLKIRDGIMTVRTAELLMAITMAAFSIYLLVKSTELPIGWVSGAGPGGGAWPFWLSAIMLISCIGIIVNWVRKRGPIATSNKVYIEPHVLMEVLAVAVALIVTVGLFSFIGIYCWLPLFLIFYFFEITLKIILPKGLTEPLFIPLYRIFF
jgi:putative tricarboxylic transport membrane protein